MRLMQPLQRMGSPADVANAVLYLASDRSAQVTGIVLPVDGGTTAGPPDGEARGRRCSPDTTDEGRRPMPADIVIRGGTVFDGSGAPGRVADVAIADGVIREIGTEPARRARARRVGLRGRARLHRHPHPLRRAGVLGSGAAAVVVPRRHHRGRRQLRLRDRADPPRAPRRDRAHARERRGHGPGDAGRGHRLGLRDVPRVPGRRCAGAEPRSTSPRTSGTPRCGST